MNTTKSQNGVKKLFFEMRLQSNKSPEEILNYVHDAK